MDGNNDVDEEVEDENGIDENFLSLTMIQYWSWEEQKIILKVSY